MRPLVLSLSRLTTSEALVIRSLVRVSEGVLTHPWRFGREDEHCDLRLIGTHQPAMRRRHRLSVDSIHFHPTVDYGLPFPPMEDSLACLLNDVGARFERTAAEAKHLFQWTPPDEALDALERVAELRAGSYHLEFEHGPVLMASFDGVRSRLALPASMNFNDLLCEVRNRARIRLQAARTPGEILARSCPLATFLMLCANVADKPQLRPVLARAIWLSLAGWPDFGLLGGQPALLKLAASMMHRPVRREQIFAEFTGETSRLVAFLNACSYGGMVRASSDANRPMLVEGRGIASVAENGVLPGLGLLSRIRLALGISLQ